MEEYNQESTLENNNEIQSWYNIGKHILQSVCVYISAYTFMKPPHHFPSKAHITVLKGSIQIDDLESSQAYILRESEDCTIPALLVHEMQFTEDVEFEFELENLNELVIYWDMEER